jgi:hypothetical protein
LLFLYSVFLNLSRKALNAKANSSLSFHLSSLNCLVSNCSADNLPFPRKASLLSNFLLFLIQRLR